MYDVVYGENIAHEEFTMQQKSEIDTQNVFVEEEINEKCCDDFKVANNLKNEHFESNLNIKRSFGQIFDLKLENNEIENDNIFGKKKID